MALTVRAEVTAAVPATVVWEYLTDWLRQGEWIPLTRVELLPREPGDRARGVGGRFRAWTGIGPVGFWDSIVVTDWEEEPDGSARCGILHTGAVVHGDAELRVAAEGSHSCRVLLWERLDVPGGAVGALLWRVAGPVLGPLLDRGAARVLHRMARRAEALAGGGAGV